MTPHTGGAAYAATCVGVLIYLGIWDYLRTAKKWVINDIDDAVQF